MKDSLIEKELKGGKSKGGAAETRRESRRESRRGSRVAPKLALEVNRDEEEEPS